MITCQILTNKGTMTADLFYMDAAKTVDNFVKLVNDEFYDGLQFWKKLDGVGILTGCQEGNGTTDLGYGIQKETHLGCQYHDLGVLTALPRKGHDKKESNASQFAICLSRKGCKQLDRNHTAFGAIRTGKEILSQLEEGDTIEAIIIEDKRPKPMIQNATFKA